MSATYQAPPEDKDLIELAAKGDSEAVREIVERHQAMVYGTCLRILGNEADAADAAQATFILFLKKSRKLKRDTVLGGWLYRTAGFVSRDFIRKSNRRKHREEKAEIMNESNEQETTQVWDELKPELDEALMTLSGRHRDVVVLRYLEGKSNDEAATTLGMTPSAVSTCLARALDKLRGHFQRRGIVVGTVVLSAALAKNASAATVPASVGSSVIAASASGALASAVTANVTLMVDGALSSMTWIKTKVIALVGVLSTSCALLSIYGLQLTSQQIDALNFTKAQTTQANAIMADYRSQYLDIEKAHTTSIREEKNFVQYEIAPFPEELEKLKERFWIEFDVLCDERQKRVARRHLALDHLFPFGENHVTLEVAYDGKVYTTRVDQKTSTGAFGSRGESEDFDQRYNRFWGDRKDVSPSIMPGSQSWSRSGGLLVHTEVLTFEGNQPTLSEELLDVLDLKPGQLVKVNRILRELRQEYLAVEAEKLAHVKPTVNDDDTIHRVVPHFRSEREALDKKLHAELGKVLDKRQFRILAETKIMNSSESILFDWGILDYDISIQKRAVWDDAERYGYEYHFDIRSSHGMGGGGKTSETEKELPEKYRRLLPE